MKKSVYYTTLIILLVICLTSCNLPQGNGSAADATAVVQTAQAAAAATLTQIAINAGGIQNPANTQAIPQIQPTDQGVKISVSVNTNCRTGPSTSYDIVGALQVGEEVQVYGRDPGGESWYIRNPDNPSSYCWVWGYYATVTGNTASIPMYTPPPTPFPSVTPIPPADFSVSYIGQDACVGFYLEFNIQNTGSVTWQSIWISIKDNTTANTFTTSANVFEDLNGCLSGTTQQDLAPGESGKAHSHTGIPYNPTGHSITATIQVCPQDNLLGTCVNKSFTFTP